MNLSETLKKSKYPSSLLYENENWRILPTFHPSYLLRNRSSMSLAWQDFKIIPELAF